MTTCPVLPFIRCEVDQEAVAQILAVAWFGLLLFIPRDFHQLVCAFCALRGCEHDLTLCEVGNA